MCYNQTGDMAWLSVGHTIHRWVPQRIIHSRKFSLVGQSEPSDYLFAIGGQKIMFTMVNIEWEKVHEVDGQGHILHMICDQLCVFNAEHSMNILWTMNYYASEWCIGNLSFILASFSKFQLGACCLPFPWYVVQTPARFSLQAAFSVACHFLGNI